MARELACWRCAAPLPGLSGRPGTDTALPRACALVSQKPGTPGGRRQGTAGVYRPVTPADDQSFTYVEP